MNPVILDRLRAVFAKLEGIEGKPGEHSDAEWIDLLERRDQADRLAEDSYYRGWVMGVLDALGIPVAEALQVLRTTHSGPRSRRRIVGLKKTSSSDSKEQNNGRR